MSLLYALLPYFVAYCVLSLCVGLVLGRIFRMSSWDDSGEFTPLLPQREPAAVTLLAAIMPS